MCRIAAHFIGVGGFAAAQSENRLYSPKPLEIHFRIGLVAPMTDDNDKERERLASEALKRGQQHYDNEEWDEAVTAHSEAIELFSEDNIQIAHSYNNRGFAQTQLMNYHEALLDFEKSIELFDDDNLGVMLTYKNRSILYMQLNEYEKAISDFTKLIELLKENDYEIAAAYENRSNAYRYLNENEKAFDDLKKAIELYDEKSHEAARIYEKFGTIYIEYQKTDEAIFNFTKAIELYGENNSASIGVYHMRGSLYYLGGNWKKALTDYKKATELSVSDPKITQEINEYPFVIYFLLWFVNICFRANVDCIQIFPNIETLYKRICNVLDNSYYDKEIHEVSHYTSLNALQTLIGLPPEVKNFKKRNGFHLYDALSTNDPNEGRVLLTNLGWDRCEKFDLGKDSTDLPIIVIGSFVMIDSNNGKDDDLTLWRFYGKTKNIEATGCNIIYKTEQFTRTFTGEFAPALIEYNVAMETNSQTPANTKRPPLFKVKYISEQEIHSELEGIKTILDSISLNGNDSENKVIKDTVQLLINSIRFLYKSNQFKNEGEARIILPIAHADVEIEMSDDINQRPHRHYYPLDKNVLKPQRITIGPAAPVGWDNFIRNYLHDEDIEVRKSEINFKPK